MLFTPHAYATCLIIEIDPENPDMAFDLCDLGFDAPEFGYVSLPELAVWLPVERDRRFLATYPISIYTQAARMACIITGKLATLQLGEAILKAE